MPTLCIYKNGLSCCDPDSRDNWERQAKCEQAPYPHVKRGTTGKRCLFQREDGTCFSVAAQSAAHKGECE